MSKCKILWNFFVWFLNIKALNWRGPMEAIWNCKRFWITWRLFSSVGSYTGIIFKTPALTVFFLRSFPFTPKWKIFFYYIKLKYEHMPISRFYEWNWIIKYVIKKPLYIWENNSKLFFCNKKDVLWRNLLLFPQPFLI